MKHPADLRPVPKPRLLDLFCGAGGAAMGYHYAGFEVVGVDVRPQLHYPFAFVQADALEFPLADFDVIHASPPCQAFSRAGKLRVAQGGSCSSPDLIEPTRLMLQAIGLPYVIENVEGAPIEGVRLCGSSFGLKVRRHRIFESSHLLMGPPACEHEWQGRPIGVYHRMGDEIPRGGKTAASIEEGSEAMGIDWMKWDELKEAIPPAYTKWIGGQLIDVLLRRVA